MKAIIIYGTRFGSTPKVAEEIVKVLTESGMQAEAFDAARNPPPPEGYDLVVIGSAIRMDSWTRETLSYLKRYRMPLAGKKVALFVCCATVLSPGLAGKVRVRYLEDVARKNLAQPPLTLGLFGGCFDYKGGHGLLYSLTSGAFQKDLAAKGLDVFGVCDFRDWDAIRAWGRSLIP
jgi:menaquinone-dependent protoporphyrinogen IX oxidase